MGKMIEVLMMIVILILAINLICGCKSFEPVQIEGECPECNDFYTVMKYNVKNTGKDSAFVGTVYAECQEARAQKRKIKQENHCAKLYFKDGIVIKTQYKQYAEFLECCKK